MSKPEWLTSAGPSDYDEACKKAADAQGITPIHYALIAAGIESVTEHTGGFCMVEFVYSADKSRALGITTDTGVYYYDDTQNSTEDDVILLGGGERYSDLYDEDGNVQPTRIEAIVNAVKENLGLLG